MLPGEEPLRSCLPLGFQYLC